MARNITTKIAIDGQAQYTQSVRDINKEIKSLNAALKLVEQEFKGNANSLEALQAKNKALSDIYVAQNKKVKELQAALKNAENAQGVYAQKTQELKNRLAAVTEELNQLKGSSENTTEREKELAEEIEKLNFQLQKNDEYQKATARGVLDWKTQLTNAQTELIKINNELKKNTAYMKEAELATDKCASSIDNYGNATKEASSNSSKMGDESKTAINELAQALAAAGVAATIKEIAGALNECVDASREFESAIAGVVKTTNMSNEQIAEYGEAIKDLATEIPLTTTELLKISEVAGQLGIEKENLLSFTEVMANLGTATNMTSEEAALMLAQFAEITQMNGEDFDKLGAAIVALGNNFATNEKNIVSMSQSIAAAAKIAGFSETDILAYSAAVTSMGISAENGGTQISKLISEMNNAVETGEGLNEYAQVAGTTAEAFAEAWGNDAAKALEMFITGLQNTEKNGKSASVVLNDLGITETRMRTAILSLSESGDILNRTLSTSRNAWKENTALQTEAALRYETTDSKVKLYENSLNNLKVAIGDKLTPALNNLSEIGTDINKWATDLIENNDGLVETVTAVAVGVGVFAVTITTLTVAAGAATKALEALKAAAIAHPWALAASAIIAAVSALATLIITSSESTISVEELTVAAGNLDEAFKEASTTFKNTENEINSTAALAERYIMQLENMGDKTSLNAKQQREYDITLKALKNTIPGLSHLINEETGEINGGTNALKQYTEAWKRNAIEQAKTEALAEKYKAVAAAQMELTGNELKLKEVTEKLNVAKAEQENYSGRMGELTYEESKRYNELRAEIQKLSIEQSKYNEAVKIGTEELEEANEEFEKTSEGAEHYGETIAQTTEEMTVFEKITAEAAVSIQNEMEALETSYYNAKEAALESIEGQIGTWEEMDNTAVTSADTINKALESQITYLNNYSNNLASLSGRNIEGIETLVSKLSDGSTESAKILAGLSTATDEEILKIIQNFGKVDEGKEKFATTVGEVKTDFTNKLGEMTLLLEETTTKWNMTEKTKTSGEQTVQGYIDGLNAKKPELQKVANEIAAIFNNSIVEENEIKSPGKKPMRLAEMAGEGAVIGLKNKEDEMRTESQKFAELMIPTLDMTRLEAAIASAQTPNISNYSNLNTEHSLNFNGDIIIRSEAGNAAEIADEIVEQVDKKLGEVFKWA